MLSHGMVLVYSSQMQKDNTTTRNCVQYKGRGKFGGLVHVHSVLWTLQKCSYSHLPTPNHPLLAALPSWLTIFRGIE